MLETLTSADFAACIGTHFRLVMTEGQIYPLELTGVKEWGEGIQAGRQPFTLAFTNPRADAYLPQQTYRLEHDSLGALDIFLVPLGPGPAGMRYEAVFS